MQIKIGILLPGSSYIPTIGKDIRQALCLGLDNNPQIDYNLIIETTRFNAEKGVVISKAQDLLIKHDVDIVVAPLNPGMLDYVAPIFSEQEVPLIAITLGEDILSETTLNPYLFVNSMNLWQSSWVSGYWGADSFGERAVSIAGYHEAGYGMSFAFALGVEAKNGSLLQSAVTHVNSSEEDPTEKIDEIAEVKPDFSIGLYSGKEAKSFLSAYSKKMSIPLISTSYGLSDSLLSDIGEKALGIPSITSLNTETTTYKNFKQIYVKNIGRAPHPYGLLAYETGLILSKALKARDQSLVESLRMKFFEGPRGKLSFDKKTQSIKTQDYLYKVAKKSDGSYYHKLAKELSLPDLFNEQIALARVKIPKQGWLNPYLIA